MFTRPLPSAPRFPVFGLDAQFSGLRWVCLWECEGNACDGALDEIQLGHGHPDQGPFVNVHTVLKRPGQVLAAGQVIEPIGLGYAASSAVIHMVESSDPASYRQAVVSPQQRALLRRELDLIDSGHDPDDVSALTHWETAAVRIDGLAHPARIRRIETAWACVIDLPELVITVSGPIAAGAADRNLADVTSRIDDYATG